MSETEGVIVGLAVKTAHGAPMELVDSVSVTEEGIEGNVHQRNERRITLLSKEQWVEMQTELGGDLPWTTRRANVLVEGLPLGDLIGKTLQVGGIEVHLYGETHPCGQMEAAQAGLQATMTPECRGGVHGSVVSGGEVRVGDTVQVLGRSKS